MNYPQTELRPFAVAERNAEIVRLRASGLSESEVARVLDCAVSTVREIWRYLGGGP